jgi:D-sedoheptulose 7-phosphate isomerase
MEQISLENRLSHIQNSLKKSAESMQKSANSLELRKQIAMASEMIAHSYRQGGSLYVAGNGGSAADAQHLVAELVAKLHHDRTPIRAFALTVDTSILTAIGNDYGYEYTFSRQVDGLMKSNDVFLGISTSGNSKNILMALEKCRSKNIPSILLTGLTGGQAKALADAVVQIPTTETQLIQESHLAIYHCLCELIEKDLIAAEQIHYVVEQHHSSCQPTSSSLKPNQAPFT